MNPTEARAAILACLDGGAPTDTYRAALAALDRYLPESSAAHVFRADHAANCATCGLGASDPGHRDPLDAIGYLRTVTGADIFGDLR